MKLKQTIFCLLVSMILLSATALAAPATTPAATAPAKEMAKPVPVTKLTANFSASSTMKAPLTVKFTDKSIGKPTTWSWNFGDKTAMSKAQNPMHKYVTAGKYKVTLIVKNAKGISSKVTKTITLKVTRK